MNDPELPGSYHDEIGKWLESGGDARIPSEAFVGALEEWLTVSNQLRQSLERIDDAKRDLASLIEHWDEHSQGRLRSAIQEIIDEVL